MVELNKDQKIFIYKYLANVSLLGLIRDYRYAKKLLHIGLITKSEKINDKL